MLGTLGWQELLIILVILALLFGATRVRDLGGALGSGIREFREQARADDEDEDGDADSDEKADAAAPASSDGDSSDSSG
ncbi:MAG TPA: twin-arginine translocase TatA/TatE family subunit [Dehalococcoidia bacterium]|jgi:sec-independent protein translocase protein TatA|nr:twin-arginine translocase TatA/TatE family subunit [Dehalococcoidia bacterium]